MNRSGLWSELDGIVEEVDQALAQLPLVSQKHDLRFRHRPRDLNPASPGTILHKAQRAANNTFQRDHVKPQRGNTDFRLGQIQKNVDEIEQMPTAVAGDTSIVTVGLMTQIAELIPSSNRSEYPAITLNGVRNSWLTFARNPVLARLAMLVSLLTCAKASSASL